MAKPRKRTTAKKSPSTKARTRAAKSRSTKSRTISSRGSRAGAARRAAASTRTRSRTQAGRASSRGQDAISLLKADHVRVKAVLNEMQKATTESRRTALVEQAEQLLKQHTMIEEQVFYPAFREAAKTDRDRRMFHEATEEHHTVDVVLPEVRAARHEPDVYAARAKVLRELVTHHIEEEQEQMFPRARRLLSEPELRELGAQMNERKRAGQPSGTLEKVGALIGLSS